MKTNLFHGGGVRAKFARILYERLKKKSWVTYADIMAEYMELDSADDLKCGVSKCDKYNDLKKAFCEVKKAIIEKTGKDSWEECGSKSKQYRYKGADPDPLSELLHYIVITDLRRYAAFCKDSAGFFPISWLEYFFSESKDLLDMKESKKDGCQILGSSLDRNLTNIEMLPMLYDYIKNEQVLDLDYKPYNEDPQHIIFHPQYLKEYNGRWHLFGHAEGKTPEWLFDVALDRIQGTPKKYYLIKYQKAPVGYYESYFNERIGVSHYGHSSAVNVKIRAHGRYMFKLMETKRMHHSQRTVTEYGGYPDGEYGEFELTVDVNNEFIGCVLQMGAGLEVMAPSDVRQMFKEKTKEVYTLYK